LEAGQGNYSYQTLVDPHSPSSPRSEKEQGLNFSNKFVGCIVLPC
jgi:hypothetical protein